ncbi:unnamed protein product [Prunus armeniaca]
MEVAPPTSSLLLNQPSPRSYFDDPDPDYDDDPDLDYDDDDPNSDKDPNPNSVYDSDLDPYFNFDSSRLRLRFLVNLYPMHLPLHKL